MANLYWGGVTGTWDISSATNWYTNAGLTIPAGAAPTTADDVFFQQSATYTVTNNDAQCRNITVSAGSVTFSNAATAVTIAGSLSFTAGTVAGWNNISQSYFISSTTGNTINTGGVAMSGSFNFSGGGSWSLSSTLSLSGGLTINDGSFNTSNNNISIGSLTSSGSLTRSITLGTSQVTLTSSGAAFSISSNTGLTFSGASSTIQVSGTAASILTPFPGLTFNNVNITNPVFNSFQFFGGNNTFSTLSFAARTTTAGVNTVTFPANVTQVIGTLSLGTSTASAFRTFVTSSVIGSTASLNVTTFSAAADVDFRDINATGAAFSGTRFGNCLGNTNISFATAKTVYYRNTGSNSWGTGTNGSWVVPISLPGASCSSTTLTTTGSPALVVGMTIVSSNGTSLGTISSGSGNSWTVTVGGTFTSQTMLAFAANSDPTMFPLAQDTAVFAAGVFPATGQTTTVNANYQIGTIDMSARTSNTMTLATGATAPSIYGNWINGSGLNNSTGSNIITFAGRGSQTITSSGKSFAQVITISTPGGSVILQDQLTCTNTSASSLSLNSGTFNANGYAVVASGGFTSSNSTVRTLAFGSGGSATWTIGGSGTSWTTLTSTNLTVTGSATISMTSASAKTFVGGGVSYSGITLNQGGAGALTITGSNTFGNITNTVQPATITFTAGTTQTVSNFGVSGTAGNLITINSSTAGTRANLSKASGTVSVSYCSIRDSNATGGATWNAYTSNGNVNVSNNLGWIFTAPSGNTSNFFLLF
jgi:hypothetical protein